MDAMIQENLHAVVCGNCGSLSALCRAMLDLAHFGEDNIPQTFVGIRSTAFCKQVLCLELRVRAWNLGLPMAAAQTRFDSGQILAASLFIISALASCAETAPPVWSFQCH